MPSQRRTRRELRARQARGPTPRAVQVPDRSGLRFRGARRVHRPDTAAGFQFLDRFPVLVLGSDGTLPAGSTSGSLDDAALVVDPKGSGALRHHATRREHREAPSPAGAGLSMRVRNGPGHDRHDRRRSPGGGGDQLRPQRPRHRQAQLVTVANGDIAVTRVLR